MAILCLSCSMIGKIPQLGHHVPQRITVRGLACSHTSGKHTHTHTVSLTLREMARGGFCGVSSCNRSPNDARIRFLCPIRLIFNTWGIGGGRGWGGNMLTMNRYRPVAYNGSWYQSLSRYMLAAKSFIHKIPPKSKS